MRAIRRHHLAVAAVLGGSLVLAACGGDGDDSTPSPAGEETATDEATHADDEMTDEMTDGSSDEMTDESSDDMTDAAGEADSAAGTAAALADVLPGASTPPASFDPSAFSGETVSGGSFDSSALDGPVVYWAWAPWCTVCRAESSDIVDAAAATEGEVTFVGVAGLGPLDDMQAFVSETGLEGIDHVADVDGQQWADLGIVGQPSYVIVGADGEAVLWPGALGEDLLAQVTDTLTA